MRLLLIDNYDSFTYNLVHIIEMADVDYDVIRNDFTEDIDYSLYDKILLSPGPGLPEEAGNLMKIIKESYNSKNLLGICLGHQAIAQFFGAKLVNMKKVYHGKTSLCRVISKDTLYENLPEVFEVGRYHSWIVSQENLPECFEITAIDENNNILSLKHKFFDIRGIQYHPESIMTPLGKKIIFNWLKK